MNAMKLNDATPSHKLYNTVTYLNEDIDDDSF